MRRAYRIYGLTVETSFDLGLLPTAADGAPDLVFTCRTSSSSVDLDELTPWYQEPCPTPTRSSDFRYYRIGATDVIRVVGAADYFLGDDEIVCYLPEERWRSLVPVHLLGLVLALWLERAGVPCLHGSAAVLDGQAVVFLAGKGAGKSSLIASLAAAGHAILTDDLLALDVEDGRVLARPGTGEVRMWPAQLARFVDDPQEFPAVRTGLPKLRVPLGAGGLGHRADRPVPVHRIYLPQRVAVGHENGIETVPPTGGLVELLRHSFLPGEVARSGWQPGRLPVLAALLAQAPIRRLSYTDGLDVLPQAHEMIFDDLST